MCRVLKQEREGRRVEENHLSAAYISASDFLHRDAVKCERTNHTNSKGYHEKHGRLLFNCLDIALPGLRRREGKEKGKKGKKGTCQLKQQTMVVHTA